MTILRKLANETSVLFLVMLAITTLILVSTDGDFWAAMTFGLCATAFIVQRAFLGTTLSLNRLTLPSIFLLVYLFAESISSIFVITGKPNSSSAMAAGTAPDLGPSLNRTYFLAIQSVLVTFPLGVKLANLLLRDPSRIVQSYVRSRVSETVDNFRFVPAFIVLTLSLGPLVLPYLVLTRHIQLFEVLKSYPTFIDPLSLRMAESEAPRVVQFCFEVARRFVLPVCTLYAYFMSYVYKRNWKFVFWIYFFAALIVSSLTLDRSLPVSLLIIMAIAYALARNQTTLQAMRNPKLLTIVALGVVAGGVISIAQYQSAFTQEAFFYDVWSRVPYRIAGDPAFMTAWAFKIFATPASFLHFRYEPFLMLLRSEYVQWDHPYWFVTPPLAFVGNLWQNWGWPAVILGPVVTGLFFQLIQLTVFTRKSVPILALHAIMLAQAIWTIYGRVLSIMTVSTLLLGLITALLFAKSGREHYIGQRSQSRAHAS